MTQNREKNKGCSNEWAPLCESHWGPSEKSRGTCPGILPQGQQAGHLPDESHRPLAESRPGRERLSPCGQPLPALSRMNEEREKPSISEQGGPRHFSGGSWELCLSCR